MLYSIHHTGSYLLPLRARRCFKFYFCQSQLPKVLPGWTIPGSSSHTSIDKYIDTCRTARLPRACVSKYSTYCCIQMLRAQKCKRLFCTAVTLASFLFKTPFYTGVISRAREALGPSPLFGRRSRNGTAKPVRWCVLLKRVVRSTASNQRTSAERMAGFV